MNPLLFGTFAGIIFGMVAIVPMFKMTFTDRQAAIIGAFINRFAVGFIIPNSLPSIDPIIRGLFIGFLLSLPDAIITKSYVPIVLLGVIGGLVIGVATKLVGSG